MTSGRKKAFDETVALEAAMDVFWKKGYIGASLADLTQAMGINKPSLYSTFGNKEALFIKATQHYIDNKIQVNLGLLSEENVPLKSRLKNYMLSVMSIQCESDQPKGCYLVLCQSELVGGDIPDEAASLLTELESAPKAMLTHLFATDDEAIALGLSENASSNALSLYTVLKGTASMARGGASSEALEPVVDNMLKGIGLH
ncbi:TetR/AcrR family transcriptional regulator [Thalassotalea piscium]